MIFFTAAVFRGLTTPTRNSPVGADAKIPFTSLVLSPSTEPPLIVTIWSYRLYNKEEMKLQELLIKILHNNIIQCSEQRPQT